MRNTRDERGGYFFFLVLDLSLTKEAFFSSNSIETRIAIPRGTMRTSSQQCRISLCGRVLLNWTLFEAFKQWKHPPLHPFHETPPTLLNPPRPHLSGLPEVIYKAEIKWRERLTISENVQYSAQHLWTQRAAQTLRSSIEAILGHRKSCRPEQNPADTAADCRRLQSRKKRDDCPLLCTEIHALPHTHGIPHNVAHNRRAPSIKKKSEKLDPPPLYQQLRAGKTSIYKPEKLYVSRYLTWLIKFK